MAEAAGGGFSASERGRTWILIAMVLAVIGVAVSVYSTWHHLQVKASGQTDAACNVNATVNCDSVALSKYSELAGTDIPLGVLGLGYFVAILVLLGLGLAGHKTAREHMHAYAAMAGIGVVVSVVLAGISAFALGTACLTCIGIYVVCLAQGGALWAFRSEMPSGATPKSILAGGSTAAIAVAVVIAGFMWTRGLLPAAAPTDTAKKTIDPNAPLLANQVQDVPVTRSAYAGLGEDYRKGADTAKVVIVEFADFQCPACQRVAGTLDALHREYGDKVQLVFRNYPLDNACNGGIQQKMHEFACKAAVMSRCAGQYGKFWEYYGIVFANQEKLSEENLKIWSKQIGLTDDQINVCWTSADALAKVKDDIDVGNKLGVDSTPTIFINGRKVLGGKGIQELRQEIDQLVN